SPWPAISVSPVSCTWVTTSEGSSSTSLASAADSFTSSLRSAGATARLMTGCWRTMLTKGFSGRSEERRVGKECNPRCSAASRRRHTRFSRDWSSDVCSSDLLALAGDQRFAGFLHMGDDKRGILLDELGQCGGQLHLVLAFGRGHGEAHDWLLANDVDKRLLR